MNEKIKVCIVIPTHQRYQCIKLLASSLSISIKISNKKYPSVFFEVFIVTSKLTNLSRLRENILQVTRPKCSKLKIVKCFTCSEPIQRNVAINYSISDYIAFLDDDLVVDEKWAERAALHVIKGDNIVQGNPIGCANPEHILSLMESYAYGDMLNRYLEIEGDNIFSKLVDGRNLLVSRDIATKFLFDSSFNLGGSGFDLSQRLNSQGYKILYDPKMKIYHFNRENIFSLVSQKIMHGRGKENSF